jgi:predicted nucleic acid-binding protein
MKAVFDTNILIDYMNGIEAARDELAKYSVRQISGRDRWIFIFCV